MKAILLLVRHAQTVWNQENRYQGQKDIPLSAKGRHQAYLLARRLEQWAQRHPIDAIWASDLSRARETAEIVAERLGLPVRTHAGLREISFGAWEGLTFPEVAEQFPEAAAAYRRDPVGTSPPEGESFLDLQRRIAATAAEILSGPGRRLLVVAHGGSLKGLLCHLLGLEPGLRHRVVIDNAALTVVLHRPGKSRLLVLNDTCHLDGGWLGNRS